MRPPAPRVPAHAHARSRSPAIPLLVFAVVAACGSDVPADATQEAPVAGAPAPDAPVFAESIEDDRCAFLTREDVAAATGIALDAIEQPYDGFCLYRWDAGPDYPDGNLNLMGLTVHGSVERARGEYATFTEDVSADEVGEGREGMRDELAGSDELSETEAEVAGVLVEAMPETGVTHQRWTGIGDAAGTDGRGTVRVLYGNVTAWITGKTDDEDWIDPDVGRRVARAVVANLEDMR